MLVLYKADSTGTTTPATSTTGTTTPATTTQATSTPATTTTTTPISNVSQTAVYFKKPSGWGDSINAYVYTVSGSSVAKNAEWHGVAMTKESDGVYSYEVPENLRDGLIIFNDGTNQIPAQNKPGISIQLGKISDGTTWSDIVMPATSTVTTGTSTTATGTTAT